MPLIFWHIKTRTEWGKICITYAQPVESNFISVRLCSVNCGNIFLSQMEVLQNYSILRIMAVQWNFSFLSVLEGTRVIPVHQFLYRFVWLISSEQSIIIFIIAKTPEAKTLQTV